MNFKPRFLTIHKDHPVVSKSNKLTFASFFRFNNLPKMLKKPQSGIKKGVNHLMALQSLSPRQKCEEYVSVINAQRLMS